MNTNSNAQVTTSYQQLQFSMSYKYQSEKTSSSAHANESSSSSSVLQSQLDYRLELSSYESKSNETTDTKDAKDSSNLVNWKDFKDQIKAKIIEMLTKSNNPDNQVDEFNSLLYQVDNNTEAAQVPEFWNAENTSQRIVDFAMSFKGVAGMDDEGFIRKIRGAIAEGFKQAKAELGDLSSPSAKLFNETFKATMKKLDDLLDQKNVNQPDNAISVDPSKLNPTSNTTNTLNLVA